MKNYSVLALICIVLTSCSKSDNTVDTILEDLESGAFIRTIEITNSDLILDDLNSAFTTLLEVQDEDEGELLESVEIFVKFNDNTLENSNMSTQEILARTLVPTDFFEGSNNLPRTNLSLSYAELVNITGIDDALIACKDQFNIRLKLNLTDGRSFSTDNASSSNIIALDTLFSSPFCYVLNIVQPISNTEFTGLYRYTSITDGFYGPTFGESKIVEIRVGDSENAREFTTKYVASRQNEGPRDYKFIVSCDEILFRKNQIGSFFTWCPEGTPTGGITLGGPPMLLGPSFENSLINPDDDSSFELILAEGYEGWDGLCGIGTIPVRILFTREE